MTEFKEMFGSITVSEIITFITALAFIVGVFYGVHKFISPRITKRYERWKKDRSILDLYDIDNAKIIRQLENLTQLVEKYELDNKKYRVISLHDKIFKLHNLFIGQGHITKDQLVTFTAIYKEYTDEGGNSVVHDKLYPEVIALKLVNSKDMEK